MDMPKPADGHSFTQSEVEVLEEEGWQFVATAIFGGPPMVLCIGRKPPILKVLRTSPPPVHDVPASLRQLADDLEAEADAYGGNFQLRVTVVIRASLTAPRVHGYGKDNPPSQAFMDLHAGAAELMSMSAPVRDV
jgi:hypothetical protein